MSAPVEHVVGGLERNGSGKQLHGLVKLAGRERLVALVLQLVCLERVDV